MRTGTFLLLALGLCGAASAQGLPDSLPDLPFHLTARPWQPLDVPSTSYLDAVEGICRFTARHQDAGGAVIDPILHREHQYATPYFAAAVATLVHAGRGQDLLDRGVRAMDHATECFAQGAAGIPDQHGEFFLASLPVALALYEDHVPAEKVELWRGRLRVPRDRVVRGGTNNWRTYAMKGEWLRSELGLADRDATLTFLDEAWLHAGQRGRLVGDRWNLYQDHTTDPESHAVEAVGRGNLLALVEAGYDGESGAEIRRLVERGTAVALLLQDPSGQCPPGGRTADHVFNDVLYQLGFEVMAERARRAGDTWRAGQYRHAALPSFQSIRQWRRSDAPWEGSYFVTKNHFDPAERVGYQPASNYANYNGAVMLHLAEAYGSRKSPIAEQPAPVEIGGYALATDERFASAVANAGGIQLFAALRGDTDKPFARYWTALGVDRIGRVGWDTRLGPSDGVRDAKTGRGISFAPTWPEGGRWVRLADVPDRYRGRFSVQFAHPLLVRCAIDYSPGKGGGPSFRHEFVLTPDGILATLRSADAREFGVTWPLLADDGAPLRVRLAAGVATTAYAGQADEQSFLAVDEGGAVVDEGDRVQSSYGWLRPFRSAAVGGVNHTFVYPRGGGDPPAEAVARSFRLRGDGYQSDIGSVTGTLYVGRTSAGGEGDSVDCDGDGKPDATFDTRCRFILQLRAGRVVAVEADRPTTVRLGDRRIPLDAYKPVLVGN